MNTLRTIPLACMLMGAPLTHGQLTVTTAPTPQQLVQSVLLGGGVTASNITYQGVVAARGQFTATNSNLGLAGGVILSTGNCTQAANPASFFASSTNNSGGDPDLQAIGGYNIFDKAILEFDFIPTGDTLRFRYVFGSEEYPDYVCGTVNDAFGFFLSGPGFNGPFSNNAVNLAVLPNTNIPITINTVNSGIPGFVGNGANCASAAGPNWQANSVYYVNNAGGGTVCYGGFTVVMTAMALVQCGQTYHIKLAIGDGGDSVFDSAVFLEEGSFTSTGQVVPSVPNAIGANQDTMLEGCGPYEMIFTRLGDPADALTVDLTVGGTATPGVDYSPAIPSQLSYAPGQASVSIFLDITPDPDGPETIVINIQQLIQCANVVVQTQYTYHISSPPPLNVVTNNINSVCGQSHVLTPVVSGGMGQYSYLWSTGQTTPTITVSPGVTTTYTVTVSDICAVVPVTQSFTVNLPVYPPLQLTVSPPTAIDCLGNGPIGVVSVSGGNNVFSYQWTLNGQVVGNTPTIVVPAASPPVYYVVTVTEGCGTSIQDSVLVSTVPLPPIEITTTGDQTVICPGDQATLEISNITGGNGVYTIQWTNASGQVLSTTGSLTVAVPEGNTYTITVNDQCGYTGTTTVSTVLPIYDPFQLSLGLDQVVCAGNGTTLHALVTGGSGYYTLDWHEVDHSDPMLWIEPTELVQYTVTATDQCGEERTDAVMVDVEYVHVDIVVTNRGQDDWYLQSATLPYAETWLWDMGDGTRYRNHEVFHSYYDLEDHWVRLWITTPNGCVGEDSVLLRPPAHIHFPNAFTPDGDGINDLFGPVGHDITEFEMTIFDRWGHPVFRTTDMNIHWDGTVNGNKTLKTEVYVFKYRAAGHYFPAVEGYGHVTLLAGSQE